MPSGSPIRSRRAGWCTIAQAAIVVAPRSRRHSKVAPASPLKDQDGARVSPGEAGAEAITGAAGAVASSV